MKKIFALLALTLLFAGCTGDKTTVINNTDRINDLEQRAALNDQLDATQSDLINLNASAISLLDTRVTILEASVAQLNLDLAAEIEARIAGDDVLANLLVQEQAAREAGDDVNAAALASAISNQQIINNQTSIKIAALQAAQAAQFITNLVVQGQLALINSKFGPINSSLTSLQSQVNNTNVAVSSLQSSVNSLQVSVSGLNSQMSSVQGSLTGLQSQINALTTRLDAEGVKVYRCNQVGSNEKFFKINGKFYAAMNHVTSENMTIITGSSSQTITTPAMCQNSSGDLKLPNSGGQCTPNSGLNAYTLIPGSSTTIPAYTTTTKKVITGVEIALEQLVSGQSYVTTDGVADCTLNGDGTNLVLSN